MSYTIQVSETGGPEVLAATDSDIPKPGPDEVLVENRAIGLNFVDIYHRTGVYPAPLPFVPGVEGAGVIAAVGDGVTAFSEGDRVVYAGLPLGAYASHRILPVERVIALPDTIAFEAAAAAFIKGLTADMLFSKVFPLERGQSILVHGAAGGLGSYLCTWARDIGAKVIGAVGSEEKAKLAREAGADDVIVGRDADFAGLVQGLMGGGVDFVVDGVGGATLEKSLAAVRPFGVVASIGQVGGAIEPVPVAQISKRSAALARPSIIAYTQDPTAYRPASERVLDKIARGLVPAIGERFSLKDASDAHRALAAGKTSGSCILVP